MPPLSVTLHGVLMEIMGVGVLLCGLPGSGKSQLALELITRGQRLVADDAPVFRLTPAGDIRGACPDVLRNYLYVRALGLLDIDMLFGPQALCAETPLDLIVELKKHDLPTELALAGPAAPVRRVLDMDVTTVRLTSAAGQSLAVLVECLVRRHLAQAQGHFANRDFCARQTQILYPALP